MPSAMSILAGVLSLLFLPVCIRVSMALNDTTLSYEAAKWVMAEFIFHGLALALLWTAILTK